MGNGTFFADMSYDIKETSSKDCTKNSSNPEKEYKEYI
jgi:hypothetical protein